MSAVMVKNHSFIATNKNMGGSFVMSGLFHAFIIMVVTMGMPFVSSDPIIITNPVSVEIVDIDELTQTNKKPARSKPRKNTSKPTPSPKVDTIKPPDLAAPVPPDIDNEVAKPRDVSVPEPLKKMAIKKPTVKPKPPAPKKIAKPKENAFDSLLKNLAPDAQETPIEVENVKAVEHEKPTLINRFSEHLTMSEEDALRRQLGQCWNVMSGAKFAEGLVVEVRVIMNPDRTLQSATILNKGRYNQGGHYRAAADAALRALRNPRCSPLALPAQKYEQWKTMIIKFDPREML